MAGKTADCNECGKEFTVEEVRLAEIDDETHGNFTHLRFAAVEDVLAFLRGQRKAGQKRGWEYVHVSSGGYALPIPKTGWKPPVALFGAEMCEGSTPGARLHLNELLYGVWLAERRTRLRRPAEILLSVETPADAALDVRRSGQAALQKAWRSLPRTATSCSRFFAAKDSRIGLDAILVTDVPTSFDFDALKKEHDHPRLRVHFRDGTRDGEPFVEWGFHYPCGDDFAMLHDQGGKDAGPLLFYAGTRVHGTEAATFFETRWHQLPAEHDEVDGALYFESETSHNGSLGRRYEYDEGARQELILPLTIDGADRSVGAKHALDGRIAVLERELEILQGRRERRRRMMEGEFVPVHLWVQPIAGDEVQLPATLQVFLNRPLAELEHYSYFRHWNEPSQEWWHFAVSANAMPAGDALAVACEQVFLQDARWAEWGLPLFVRSDCALSVDVNEQEIADKLKREIGLDAAAGISLVLLAPPAGVTSPASAGPPAFYTVANADAVRRLNDVLEWVNQHGDGALTAVRLMPVEFESANTQHRLEIQDATLRMDANLTERASQLLGNLEAEWADFRQRAEAQLGVLRLGDILLEATRKPYAEAGADWAEFISRAVEINEAIAKAKLTQLVEWNTAEKKRLDGLTQVAAALAPVTDRISGTKEALGPLVESTNEANRMLGEELETVQGVRAELSAANEEFERRFATLAAERKQYDTAVAATEAAIRLAKDELEKIEARRAADKRTREYLADIRGKITEAHAGAREAETENAREKQELRSALQAGAALLGLNVAEPAPKPNGFWARLFGRK